jgi:hypothetical protein
MNAYLKLIRLEFYVLRHDPKVRIKLMISFLLVLYVLAFSYLEKRSNIMPFFFFGFFFATPLIDYSFYMERVNKRFPLLLGKGFTLRQIFVSKSLVIFITGLTSGLVFTFFALFLNSTGILNAGFEKIFVLYFFVVSIYSFWAVLFGGVIQARFEIIFPVRLLNILAFVLFVNFQENVVNSFLKYHSISLLIIFTLLSVFTIFITGKLNKDKIS